MKRKTLAILTAAAMAAGANIWAAFFGTEGVFQVLDRIISIFDLLG